MARSINKLTEAAVKNAKKPGRLSDGGGLYLRVKPSGTKSWAFMWVPAGGTRREMGIGRYPDLSLASARKRAEACRQMVAEGRDPIEERAREAEPTFGEAAKRYLEAHRGTLRNAKHAAQWRTTLLGGGRGLDYCKSLRPLRVSEIRVEHILAVLQPAWDIKPETMSRIRGRIEAVLDAEAARGNRDGDNPARWRGKLQHLLGKRQRLIRGHHRALLYRDLPAFMSRLRKQAGVGARALEFAILTAARSGEVRGATWDEVDLDAALWIVPSQRMKAGRTHRVPLCNRAMAILEEMRKLSDGSGLIFPSAKRGKPMSDMTLSAVLRRMDVNATVHGFRSSFRDWCGEETHFPREVAEQALAHAVGNQVERAYRRGDALEKRRGLMAAWEGFIAGSNDENVVPLRGRQ